MMSDQEILEKYKVLIAKHIKELLEEEKNTNISEIEAFAKKYKENFIIGFRKGEAKGIEIAEAKRNIEIAKEMLLDGDSVEKIARITGLSVSEIVKLKKV